MNLNKFLVLIDRIRDTNGKEFIEYLFILTANELLVIARTELILLCIGPFDFGMSIKPYDV